MRLLVTLFVFISILISLTTSAEWLRSCFVGDAFGYHSELVDGNKLRERTVALYFARGRIGAFCYTEWETVADLFRKGIKPELGSRCFLRSEESLTAFKFEMSITDKAHSWLGFEVSAFSPVKSALAISGRFVIVPCWFIVAVSAIAPTWRISSYIRRRRNVPLRYGSLCPTCGYDVRASSVICSECGSRLPRVEIPWKL